MDFRRKIENNWSFVLHEAPFFSVLAASSAARLLRSTFSIQILSDLGLWGGSKLWAFVWTPI